MREQNRERCPNCKYNEGEHSLKPCGRCLYSIDNCYFFPNDEMLAKQREISRKLKKLTCKCSWCEGMGKLTEDGRPYSEVE